MFTGIIEEKGTITEIKKQNQGMKLSIKGVKVLEDVSLGDSIAVNGVCLTVTGFNDQEFSVDVMPETFQGTTLSQLRTSTPVNLERAMSPLSRFGGHMVSGHIDGKGTVVRRKQVDNAVYFDIQAPKRILKYIVQKGSVAVDGTSLTVFGLKDSHFTISIIPHTLDETIMGTLAIGDEVNIECDLIGKYVERLVTVSDESAPKHNLAELLQQNGYM
ncbi:riboflavin synthase [Shouchella lehensis]|uniref:Riboflavin synthase n=1 Tax=Shouchella lehensis TaxID=300825 RepID=A0A4Y7WPG5_9BACI|nr:riboflavin synthase [Shouchella lehensis]MBG9784440.1 riboflavin synthase subunit alpha [Shouchella lehensis]RQW20543.1 riboflavin synthase [Bacillus sp. C1-1]TES50556.1 riboflavin synthase [Shouchella lehensis]